MKPDSGRITEAFCVKQRNAWNYRSLPGRGYPHRRLASGQIDRYLFVLRKWMQQNPIIQTGITSLITGNTQRIDTYLSAL